MTPVPAPPGPSADKATWRRWAAGLAPVTDTIADAVTEHLLDALGDTGGVVLGYVALGDEVPIARLLASDALGAAVALPRLGDDGVLSVHLDDGVRETHRFGIEQPPAGLVAVAPEAIAAVLVPGRVFDRDGYRLGRGGGHYDRLAPRLAPGTRIIGVATRARIVDRLPREPHDCPMTDLVTEQGLYSMK